MKRLHCLVVLFIVFSAFRLAEPATAPVDGGSLYATHCVRCHGADGARGKWGAHDLRASRMTDAAIVQRVRQGKGIMPAFGTRLTDKEIAVVVAHVKALRQQ